MINEQPEITAKLGDIQIDSNGSEWIVVGVATRHVSRVRRYSIAHQVHAKDSPVIAESLEVDE